MSKSINAEVTTAILSKYPLELLNSELKSRGAAPAQDPKTGATMLAMGLRSLDEFTATVVNLSEGRITAPELGELMARAFPGHKIGERHGAHYLSLARNGNLSGNVECRFAPAKGARKAPRKGHASIDLRALDAKQRAALAKMVPELAAAIAALDAE